jgi:hypothetical protein
MIDSVASFQRIAEDGSFTIEAAGMTTTTVLSVFLANCSPGLVI